MHSGIAKLQVRPHSHVYCATGEQGARCAPYIACCGGSCAGLLILDSYEAKAQEAADAEAVKAQKAADAEQAPPTMTTSLQFEGTSAASRFVDIIGRP